MTTALYSGPSADLFFGFFGGFICAVIYLIWGHYSTYKTKYYSDEFIYFSIGKKLILYISFLLANLLVAFLLFWLLSLTFAAVIF